MYLYDDNYLNDVEYLLNKDVLFEKIPYLIAQSLTGDYDEGNSYNWAQWKSFNSDMILGLYIRKKTINEMKSADFYSVQLEGNLALLEKRSPPIRKRSLRYPFPPTLCSGGTISTAMATRRAISTIWRAPWNASLSMITWSCTFS